MDKFVQAYASTPLLGRFSDADNDSEQDGFMAAASSSSGGYHAAIPQFQLPNVNNVRMKSTSTTMWGNDMLRMLLSLVFRRIEFPTASSLPVVVD